MIFAAQPLTFRGANQLRSGSITHMRMKAAKNRARTWLLRCVKCKSHFNVGISPSESIILIARKTLCPNCGHLPTLTQPDAFLSAAQIHRLVRVTQWERSRAVPGRADRRLRKGESISVIEQAPTSTRASKSVTLNSVALKRIAQIVWGPESKSRTRTRRRPIV
jgi:DNA-directed RNA polymerase subunit RPC12/RpoP